MRKPNYRGKTDARRISYQSAVRPGADKSMSVTSMEYHEDDKRVKPLEPLAVTKVRKFDQIADFITTKNITGADPLFGKETPAHNIVFDTQKRAILGPDHELNYLGNKYNLVSHRDRNIIHFIKGIDLSKLPADGAATPLAIVAQQSFISKMINVLNTNLYTEDEKLPLQVGFSKTAPTAGNEASWVGSDAAVAEMLKRRLSPLGTLLLGYDTEYHALASFLVQYDLLVAMLPKLQTRYYKAQVPLAWLQGQLKRAAVRSQIDALKSSIKRRYVDRVSLNRVAKTLGVSADTEGINSSIDSLTQFYFFPNLSCTNTDDKGAEIASSRIIATPLFGHLLRQAQPTTESVSLGKINMWEIGEAITNALLDAETGDLVKTKAMFDAWTDWLAKLYNRMPAWEANVLKLEGLFARLSAIESGFTPSQGLEIGDVVDVEKMVDDKFITGLFSMPVSEPIAGSEDSNGFAYRAPLFRLTGMHVNSVEQGFMQYFLPSDDKNIAWGKVGDQIRVELRHVRHTYTMTQDRSKGSILWTVDLGTSPLEIQEATTLMFADIPLLKITKGNTSVTLQHPDLLAFLTLRQEYNSPEVQTMLWAQQPIPVA